MITFYIFPNAPQIFFTGERMVICILGNTHFFQEGNGGTW